MANQENPWADPARETLQTGSSNNNNNNPYYQSSNSPNPWASGQQEQSQFAPPPGPPPNHQEQSYQPQQQSHASYASADAVYDGFSPNQNYSQPPNPSYGQAHPQSQSQPFQPQPPARTGTFEDPSIIPPSERGEQREAMEQFEMSNPHGQSTDDRNLETLQSEFPKLDGSLVAAIYGDSKDMGATREMLGELSQSQGGS